MTEISKEYIGKIIQNARKKQGLKQSELAEMVGISVKHMSKIETGTYYPALENFLKMVEILKLSFKDFGIIENENISPKQEEFKKIAYTTSDKELEYYMEMIELIKKHS